jgi:predicted PhzF superfamily epimerase YddE/YHI9
LCARFSNERVIWYIHLKVPAMKQTLYQVDAFTSEVFRGNPAAVCILEDWIDDEIMQKIANENNLSETAFAVRGEEVFEIRWFTPAVEVDLCGHATLATAHVLFEHLGFEGEQIRFRTLHSGQLSVVRKGDMLVMDFPADVLEEMEIPDLIPRALRKNPLKGLFGKTDLLFIFASQSEIENMNPDFELLKQLGGRGVIVSAMGTETDFVSRFFAPQTGINEDPVTGSAHTTLTPYWAKVLGRKRMTARQLSSRGGEIRCEHRGDRVWISGRAVTYLVGEIMI